MAIAIYMDVHIPRAITVGLRLRGVDVVTAQEDDSANLADPELLERATALQRVLFTFDDDLLIEATKRQLEGNPFTGLIYAHPSRVSIGNCIRDIEIIARQRSLMRSPIEWSFYLFNNAGISIDSV